MISVCIATHNGGKFIKEQLQSILVQLDKNDEIVISDDGSTDCTIDEILSLRDSRIRVVKMVHIIKGKKPHYYVTKNFENALRNAKGEIIFLSDQDDVWMSGKVRQCIAVLEQCDLVISNLECVDIHLNPLGEYIYTNNFRFHNYLMRKGKYYGCAMAFKRKVLEYALPFPHDLLLHDFWLGILVELLGKVEYINTPLVKYRIHSNNTSGFQKSKNALTFKIMYRAYTMWNVYSRFLKYKILSE